MPGTSAESDGVQQPLHCRSTSLLRLSHQPTLQSPFVKTACMQTFTSQDTCPVSPASPVNAVPTTTSHQHQQSHYLLASSQWEISATSNRDQRRKWMSQFWISQNAEENKPAPTKREREGKSGRSLNRLERCPNNWKLVIGLYFTLPPEK